MYVNLKQRRKPLEIRSSRTTNKQHVETVGRAANRVGHTGYTFLLDDEAKHNHTLLLSLANMQDFRSNLHLPFLLSLLIHFPSTPTPPIPFPPRFSFSFNFVTFRITLTYIYIFR